MTWPTNDEERAAGRDPDTGVPLFDVEDQLDDLRTLREFLETIDDTFPSTRVDSALMAVGRLEASIGGTS